LSVRKKANRLDRFVLRHLVQHGSTGAGIHVPQALSRGEAARIRALYTADRAAYQATFRPKNGDVIQVGDVELLTYPMYGLSAGKLFRVTQAADLVQNNMRTTTVILSLQTDP